MSFPYVSRSQSCHQSLTLWAPLPRGLGKHFWCRDATPSVLSSPCGDHHRLPSKTKFPLTVSRENNSLKLVHTSLMEASASLYDQWEGTDNCLKAFLPLEFRANMIYDFSQALRGHAIHGHLYTNKWLFKGCFQESSQPGISKKGRYTSTPKADELSKRGVCQRKPSPLRLKRVSDCHHKP